MIIVKTIIGKSIQEVAGTNKAHGEAGVKYVDAARKRLGLPEEHYFVSQDVRDYFAEHKKTLLAEYDRWEKSYNDWRSKNPDEARQLDDAIEKKVPADLFTRSRVPRREDRPRKAGSEFAAVAKQCRS